MRASLFSVAALAAAALFGAGAPAQAVAHHGHSAQGAAVSHPTAPHRAQGSTVARHGGTYGQPKKVSPARFGGTYGHTTKASFVRFGGTYGHAKGVTVARFGGTY